VRFIEQRLGCQGALYLFRPDYLDKANLQPATRPARVGESRGRRDPFTMPKQIAASRPAASTSFRYYASPSRAEARLHIRVWGVPTELPGFDS